MALIYAEVTRFVYDASTWLRDKETTVMDEFIKRLENLYQTIRDEYKLSGRGLDAPSLGYQAEIIVGARQFYELKEWLAQQGWHEPPGPAP